MYLLIACYLIDVFTLISIVDLRSLFYCRKRYYHAYSARIMYKKRSVPASLSSDVRQFHLPTRYPQIQVECLLHTCKFTMASMKELTLKVPHTLAEGSEDTPVLSVITTLGPHITQTLPLLLFHFGPHQPAPQPPEGRTLFRPRATRA